MHVLIMSSNSVKYDGKARSVILPGENGVFEALSFHRRLISRLLRGIVEVDGREFMIERGIAKIGRNEVIVVMEE